LVILIAPLEPPAVELLIIVQFLIEIKSLFPKILNTDFAIDIEAPLMVKSFVMPPLVFEPSMVT
jgi:hypothetical protein